MSRIEVKPYGNSDKTKKEEVAEMFNNISKKTRNSHNLYALYYK